MAYNKKIFIIDDEKDFRQLLVDKFIASNFEVFDYANGNDCVQYIDAEKPDIILLDIDMPGKNGIEILQEIRNTNWGSDVPVFMLTNMNDENLVAEAVALGSFDYFIKSDWQISDIVQKVKDRLGA